MLSRTVLVVAITALLASCTNVLRVKERVVEDNGVKYKTIGGVPFYVKREQFKQTTLYTKTWLKATLTVDKRVLDSKVEKEFQLETSKQVFVTQLLKETSDKLSPIRIAIMNADIHDGDDAETVIKQFEALESICDDTRVKAVLVTNVVESEWVVDERQKYYLNAPLPWFGSASLTQEINPDGTLSKAISTPDTKMAEGISALIPLKEYLTGRFVEGLEDKSTEEAMNAVTPAGLTLLKAGRPGFRFSRDKDEVQVVYVLSLSTEETGHEYTFTRVHMPPQPEPPTAILFDTEKYAFSRRDIGHSAQPSEVTGDGTTVEITGSIRFPDDSSATGPAKP